MCVLPYSGYILRFSHVMGLTADGFCDAEYKTEPDVLVQGKIGQDTKYDKVIQNVIEIQHEE